MATPQIFESPLDKKSTQRLAAEGFGDFIKFVADLNRKIICAGGGLHADAKDVLVATGSSIRDLWGANYYPERPPLERMVFRSMINIRPADGNTQQHIQSEAIRQEVRNLALYYFEGKPL